MGTTLAVEQQIKLTLETMNVEYEWIEYDGYNNPYVTVGWGAIFGSSTVKCVLSDISQTAPLFVGAEVEVEGAFTE